MKTVLSYIEARDLLVEQVQTVSTETINLEACAERILAQDITAIANVPPFDRSPFDGYAFRSEDSRKASKEHPVTLQILEEIPAGGISHCPVTNGCAVKILTGAPIPEGADAVTKFEITEFTDETVMIFEPSESGSNIVREGEDVKVGDVLAKKGVRIDPGTAGVLAAQNMTHPLVYRMPKIGIISTGSELLEVGSEPEPGKIYDSNLYMLSAAVSQIGCRPVLLGMVKDDEKKICEFILKGLAECDAVLLTGGVSVGDYDLTPAAMESAGAEILFRGVDLKPGMACAYGVKDGKLICGLSGNPASAITNLYAVAFPALKKLCGYQTILPPEIQVTLLDGFKKKSRGTRVLRGILELTEGTVGMRIPKAQGNVVLSSTIGCNVMAVIPAGTGPLEEGTQLKGFLI